MSANRDTTARHRADGPAKTPLTNVADNAGVLGRRSAVVAASSGLAMSMGLPSASAAPTAPESPLANAAQAVEEPSTATISVSADVKVDFSGTTITVATPAPVGPTPEELAAQARAEQRRAARAEQQAASSRRASTQTSRSTERAAPTTPAAAPAKQAPVQAASGGSSATGNRVVAIARQYTGTMYRYGGTTPAGFDCSGFTQYVYRQVGVSLPRTSGSQRYAGRQVSASQARPGDLVWKPGHVGIYVGNGMMIDSPRTGKAISTRKIYFSNPVFIRVTG